MKMYMLNVLNKCEIMKTDRSGRRRDRSGELKMTRKEEFKEQIDLQWKKIDLLMILFERRSIS